MAVHRVIGVELLLVLESLFCYVYFFVVLLVCTRRRGAGLARSSMRCDATEEAPVVVPAVLH